MAGLAALARELGHDVSGSDANVYPPMSTQLEQLGIPVQHGYADVSRIDDSVDVVVVGNAISRGNPLLEAVLDRGAPYTSGPQWLADHVLAGRWVIAVAGTHGKTTTAAMAAWILEHAGLNPGFLIGGVPTDFGVSARLGSAPFFVIEADEYDTAFFDKRSKFVHYRPRTAVLNNLEFDHADIFPDVESIERQFHHLVRTVPASGRLVVNAADLHLARVLQMGCWSDVEYFLPPGQAGSGTAATAWTVDSPAGDFRGLRVRRGEDAFGPVQWKLAGAHNAANALAAVLAARHAGVEPGVALEALSSFRCVRRRMEVRGIVNGVTVYDDFAHHPTEIAATIAACRGLAGAGRVLAVVEPRSNTMRMGVHGAALSDALSSADLVRMLHPADLGWDPRRVLAPLGDRARVFDDVDALATALANEARTGDHVLIMSNGSFQGIHDRLLARLTQ